MHGSTETVIAEIAKEQRLLRDAGLSDLRPLASFALTSSAGRLRCSVPPGKSVPSAFSVNSAPRTDTIPDACYPGQAHRQPRTTNTHGIPAVAPAERILQVGRGIGLPTRLSNHSFPPYHRTRDRGRPQRRREPPAPRLRPRRAGRAAGAPLPGDVAWFRRDRAVGTGAPRR